MITRIIKKTGGLISKWEWDSGLYYVKQLCKKCNFSNFSKCQKKHCLSSAECIKINNLHLALSRAGG